MLRLRFFFSMMASLELRQLISDGVDHPGNHRCVVCESQSDNEVWHEIDRHEEIHGRADDKYQVGIRDTRVLVCVSNSQFSRENPPHRCGVSPMWTT